MVLTIGDKLTDSKFTTLVVRDNVLLLLLLLLLHEGAVASTAVKLRLRECLLNKSQRELSNISNSPPELRQWLVSVVFVVFTP